MKKKKNKNEEDVKEKRKDEVEKKLDKDELNEILLEVKKLDSKEDLSYYEEESLDVYNLEITELLTSNLDDTIEYLENVEDEDDFCNIAYNFPNINRKFKSQRFIDCIEKNATKFPYSKPFIDFEIFTTKLATYDDYKYNFNFSEDTINIIKTMAIPNLNINEPINKKILKEILDYLRKELKNFDYKKDHFNENRFKIYKASFETYLMSISSNSASDYDELNRLLGLS